jgi:rSAM/selenodomain-associated transferase 1
MDNPRDAYRHARARILVFAKAPIAGRAKTRLIPMLGAEGAAELHESLLADTVGRLASARVAPLELWCTPSSEHPAFQTLGTRYSVPLFEQTGADLGERMMNAAHQALGRAEYVVLIGTDCPGLSAAYLGDALDALVDHSGALDAVLGPAQDGGYVLLALRSAPSELFRDVPWGDERVAELTRRRMRQLHWRWRELGVLRDIDRPEDLRWYRASEAALGATSGPGHGGRR